MDFSSPQFVVGIIAFGGVVLAQFVAIWLHSRKAEEERNDKAVDAISEYLASSVEFDNRLRRMRSLLLPQNMNEVAAARNTVAELEAERSLLKIYEEWLIANTKARIRAADPAQLPMLNAHQALSDLYGDTVHQLTVALGVDDQIELNNYLETASIDRRTETRASDTFQELTTIARMEHSGRIRGFRGRSQRRAVRKVITQQEKALIEDQRAQIEADNEE